MSTAITKDQLVTLISSAIGEYLNWPFEFVNNLPDDTFVEREGGTPGIDGWQIEIMPLQRWFEGETEVIQLDVTISDGEVNIVAVIEYYSNGDVSYYGPLMEIIDGIPHPICK